MQRAQHTQPRRGAECGVSCGGAFLCQALLASEKYKCSDDLITILSMLTVGNSIFYRPKDRAVQ